MYSISISALFLIRNFSFIETLLFSQLEKVKSVPTYLIAAPTMLSRVTAHPQPATSTAISIDPTVLAALIGGTGAILAAFIAGVFVIYQVGRTAQVEQKRQEEQHHHEEEMA